MNARGRQQVALALLFSGQIVGGVVSGNVFVSLGIPFVVINAIQDSSDGLGALLQNSFEAKAKLGRLDFLAVFATHGGHHVRVRQRALQKIDIAEIFHLRNGEQVPRQHQQRQNLRRKQTLVSHVVNREDQTCVEEGWIFRVLRAQKNRNQR